MQSNHRFSSLGGMVGSFACLLSLFCLASAEGTMTVFSPPDGGCSVYMEGKPITKTASWNGAAINKCYGHDEKDGGYWVTWSEAPIANTAPADVVNKALSSACTGAVRGMHATEGARYSINLSSGYPGRQIEGALPNGAGFFRMRMFLVGNRLYQLTVVGIKPYFEQTNPNQFLNSLSVANPATRTVKSTITPSSAPSPSVTDRRPTDMQSQSSALHKRIQEQQDKVRKNLEAARARRTSGWWDEDNK